MLPSMFWPSRKGTCMAYSAVDDPAPGWQQGFCLFSVRRTKPTNTVLEVTYGLRKRP